MKPDKDELVLQKRKVSANLADFRILKFLANGAFGRVYQVEECSSGKRYVMKQTFQNPRFANREGEISALVDHPCIVKFHYVFYEKHGLETYLHLVMDEFPLTLQKYLDIAHKNQQTPIAEETIKLFTKQILLGLQHLHSKGIAHRDLKPDNLLIDTETSKMVLCDLGSAKRVADGTYNKSYICSRLYRAPELLCGCEEYSTKIDIWSTGCVMGECYLLRPVFPGKNNKQQLLFIQRLLGNLTHQEIATLKQGSKMGFMSMCRVQVKYDNWEKAVQSQAKTLLSDDAVNLLKQMLQYDSYIRSSSDLCLASRYFQNVELPG